MIEAIIFDVGGVYLKGDTDDFVNKAYKILGVDEKFNSGDKVIFDLDLNRGRISIEECFRKFFDVDISEKQMEELKEVWSENWKPTKEMNKLISKLQKRYKLAVLSNSEKCNSERFSELG